MTINHMLDEFERTVIGIDKFSWITVANLAIK